MNDYLSCDEVKELLSPYFDGELNATTSKLLKQHLGQCLTCRRELENLKKLSVLIKTAYTKSPLYIKKRRNNIKRMVSSSVAAAVFVGFLGWFSVSSLKIDKTSTIEVEKPMYVKSEEYVLSDIYAPPEQEVLSFIYDK